MNASPDKVVAQSVRRILGSMTEGAAVDGKGRGQVFNGLNGFICPLLRDAYADWKHESIDGFVASRVCKRGRCAIEIVGVCILISDQTVTPIRVCLEISPSSDEVVWMECRLGVVVSGTGAMMRVPYSEWRGEPLKAVVNGIEGMEWVYRVTHGVKNGFTRWG